LKIAGSPDNLFTRVDSFNDLARKLVACEGGHATDQGVELTKGIRHKQPTRGVPQGGDNSLGLVRDGELVTAVVSVFQHPTPRPPPRRVDLIYVLDVSGSVGSRFQKQMELAAGMLDVLTSENRESRVAIVKFSSKGKSRVVLPLK